MVRQHVNPLSRFFQLPLELPAPAALFADPTQPIHLDIGCARGRFLLALAPLQPQGNHLGVEIRRGLVAAAEAERIDRGLGNLSFLFCNANISLEAWLSALPVGQLELVSIQFPDPWFKKKHHKRRVLQPALLLLEKPAKVGDTGKITGMHVGTVALRFTANYAPLTGKRFTLRREAFVECATLEDSPAGLQKFVEAVSAGAEMSATTNEQIPCKKCGGVGFTREAQKGQLLDKRIPCADCVSSGKVIISVETKFIP